MFGLEFGVFGLEFGVWGERNLVVDCNTEINPRIVVLSEFLNRLPKHQTPNATRHTHTPHSTHIFSLSSADFPFFLSALQVSFVVRKEI